MKIGRCQGRIEVCMSIAADEIILLSNQWQFNIDIDTLVAAKKDDDCCVKSCCCCCRGG